MSILMQTWASTSEGRLLRAGLPNVFTEVQTVFGSCPAAGGTSFAAAQTVTDKWGSNASVRQFLGGLQAPNYPATSKIVHISFNSTGLPTASLIAGALDSSIAAWAAALTVPTGTVLVCEWMHEMDSKYRKSQITLADGIAGKNRFYDVVRANVSSGIADQVKVAATYTGWLFEALDPSLYSAVRADWLGVDFDGVDANSSGVYPPWTNTLATVESWVDTLGYGGWCAPEFGSPRWSGDTDGSSRGAWMLSMGQQMKNLNAEYVAAFEYPTDGAAFELTTTAEISSWASLCALS